MFGAAEAGSVNPMLTLSISDRQSTLCLDGLRIER
jgi:hypothetical protein